MYQNKRILAIIPARSGSKGVPGKNHKLIAGRLLVEWTFQAAKGCNWFDEIICSTDDLQIMKATQKANITLMKRPACLSQDTTPMLDVLLDVLARLEKRNRKFDYIVLLQPTSPLRTATDITRAIKQFFDKKGLPSAASVTPIDLRPGLLLTGTESQGILFTSPLVKNLVDIRRQDAPKLYMVNGAIYIYKRNFLRPGAKLNTPAAGILLPKSHTLDIDTWQDFKRCEKALLRRKQPRF